MLHIVEFMVEHGQRTVSGKIASGHLHALSVEMKRRRLSVSKNRDTGCKGSYLEPGYPLTTGTGHLLTSSWSGVSVLMVHFDGSEIQPVTRRLALIHEPLL